MKTGIDMGRTTTMYAGAIGALTFLSLLTSNIPALAFSHYIELALRKELCAGLFLVGTLAGVIAFRRHAARAQAPWMVPQSQVTWSFVVFFAAMLVAVILSH